MGEAKRRAANMGSEGAETLGDGPIDPAFRGNMNAIAAVIDEVFNGENPGEDRKVGFILMTFPYDAPAGRCNYISNGADRKDVAAFLREQVAYFESQAQPGGSA